VAPPPPTQTHAAAQHGHLLAVGFVGPANVWCSKRVSCDDMTAYPNAHQPIAAGPEDSSSMFEACLSTLYTCPTYTVAATSYHLPSTQARQAKGRAGAHGCRPTAACACGALSLEHGLARPPQHALRSPWAASGRSAAAALRCAFVRLRLRWGGEKTWGLSSASAHRHFVPCSSAAQRSRRALRRARPPASRQKPPL
jgi:hypothetical protein